MQDIWQRKYDWDQPLPVDVRSKCQKVVLDFQKVSATEIPRWYFTEQQMEENGQLNTKLHIFTDASQSAYKACAYILNRI